ncbi:MAG TPA: LysM peptidoglycan-binding domain-containing protein, partial [bacterium]|nr:LysM peptidoglycan-binding domain-containing protein [bacterium]
AKELGGDVALPESLVTEARDLFKKSDYLESKKKADEAYELADRMLKEIMKTREELRRMAELEKDKAFPLTYVVQPWETSKDCLWNIAKKKNIYDDPWKWKKIYMANKEQIKDPDLIYTGQVLKISR